MSGLSEYKYQSESSSGSEYRSDSSSEPYDSKDENFYSDDEELEGLGFTSDYFLQLMASSEAKHYVKVSACEVLTDYLFFANPPPSKAY
ncbi:hypothetical protein DIURU_004416 [Diutina rugosa]|uniref:Uncharacterized protein n=1 Tax=Diutina rugosa TaxID=5481 RepID=A0A642UHT5_DIURU|nr:uncharacterized protein DIURU_004416 [Diutina rugosa]KAA8899234.1 hypothetical protein DIURU_004416 [Diutina rugosa]